MITVTTNAEAVRRMTQRLASEIPATLRADLSKWAIYTATQIRRGAPRATGALKRSIRGGAVAGRDGPAAEITAGMDYAPYLEFGTRRMRARRFFFDVIIGAISDLRIRLAESLYKATQRATRRG